MKPAMVLKNTVELNNNPVHKFKINIGSEPEQMQNPTKTLPCFVEELPQENF